MDKVLGIAKISGGPVSVCDSEVYWLVHEDKLWLSTDSEGLHPALSGSGTAFEYGGRIYHDQRSVLVGLHAFNLAYGMKVLESLNELVFVPATLAVCQSVPLPDGLHCGLVGRREVTVLVDGGELWYHFTQLAKANCINSGGNLRKLLTDYRLVKVPGASGHQSYFIPGTQIALFESLYKKKWRKPLHSPGLNFAVPTAAIHLISLSCESGLRIRKPFLETLFCGDLLQERVNL